MSGAVMLGLSVALAASLVRSSFVRSGMGGSSPAGGRRARRGSSAARRLIRVAAATVAVVVVTAPAPAQADPATSWTALLPAAPAGSDPSQAAECPGGEPQCVDQVADALSAHVAALGCSHNAVFALRSTREAWAAVVGSDVRAAAGAAGESASKTASLRSGDRRRRTIRLRVTTRSDPAQPRYVEAAGAVAHAGLRRRTLPGCRRPRAAASAHGQSGRLLRLFDLVDLVALGDHPVTSDLAIAVEQAADLLQRQLVVTSRVPIRLGPNAHEVPPPSERDGARTLHPREPASLLANPHSVGLSQHRRAGRWRRLRPRIDAVATLWAAAAPRGRCLLGGLDRDADHSAVDRGQDRPGVRRR